MIECTCLQELYETLMELRVVWLNRNGSFYRLQHQKQFSYNRNQSKYL